MSHLAPRLDVERFRAFTANRLGLHFDDTKLDFLAEVLWRRLESTGLTADAYLDRAETQLPRSERQALARELTVGETYFFRNIDQFHALRQAAVPERLRAAAQRRCPRVLSAGCASGEEPYTIAMVLKEALPDASWDISIRAVDINPAMLEKAARARFSRWSLRETPPDAQQKWFRAESSDAVLDAAVRDLVTFEERNLVDADADLWQPETYDIIFCRNVIMYFEPHSGRALVDRISRALVPGGYLFIGHAETLRGISSDFHLCHTHGTFYYQRRDGYPRQGAARHADREAAAVPVAAYVDAVETSGSWVEAIGRATQRIQALSREATPSEPVVHAPYAAPDLRRAWDLLQHERFGEALDLIHSLPPESVRDPDVQLLHAVLLAHGGRFGDAENVCRRLLETDELNAGAHYILALCREGVRDAAAAVEHDHVAVYLDPDFAMPRLHLGLLARRAGDRPAARGELEQALALLQREEPSRLLLFAGGFSREALMALCRAELAACGDRR